MSEIQRQKREKEVKENERELVRQRKIFSREREREREKKGLREEMVSWRRKIERKKKSKLFIASKIRID